MVWGSWLHCPSCHPVCPWHSWTVWYWGWRLSLSGCFNQQTKYFKDSIALLPLLWQLHNSSLRAILQRCICEDTADRYRIRSVTRLLTLLRSEWLIFSNLRGNSYLNLIANFGVNLVILYLITAFGSAPTVGNHTRKELWWVMCCFNDESGSDHFALIIRSIMLHLLLDLCDILLVFTNIEFSFLLGNWED